MRSSAPATAALIFTAACGGPKDEPTPEAKVDVTVDSASMSAPAQGPPHDTMKPLGDTVGVKRADGPLRDSAFGPKYTINEKAGKVTPIQKRP